MKIFTFLILLLLFSAVSAQIDSVKIWLKYDGNSSLIHVHQEFNVQRNTQENHFLLYAWANAFKDKNTVLAKTKLKDRNDALYFAPLSDRGWIEDLHFFDSENKKIPYSQINNEMYRLNTLKTHDRLIFSADYRIHLPNRNITGYGIDEQGNILLKYFFLQPAMYNQDGEVVQYFKDFESLSANNTNYTLYFETPPNYEVFTDLKEVEKNVFTGLQMDFFQLAIQAPGSTHSITTPFGTVHFGVDLSAEDVALLEPVLSKELRFLEEHLGKLDEPLYISGKNYRKNKFQGVQDVKIPLIGTYKIFDPSVRLQLEMISQLTSAFTDRKILVDMRQDHWIRNGIQMYLQMEYIEQNFPDLLLAGHIPDDIRIWKLKPLKWFEASKIKMTERTQLWYRMFLTANLDQSIDTPFDELSNLNQTNVSSYKSGLAMHYLAVYLGKPEFDNLLECMISEHRGQRITAALFRNYFVQNSSKDVRWLFDELISFDKNFDFAIRSIKKTEDSLVLNIRNKSELKTPIRISGFENGIKVYDNWLENPGKKITYRVPARNYDYLVLNDSIGFPDFNLNNNYIRPKGILRRKLKIGLVTDIPSPKHAALFIFPEVEWNNYDKFQAGITFSNKTILPQPWQFKAKPQYSTGENALTGSFISSYNLYPNHGWFRQIKLSGSASYQHFNQGLAYKSYGAGSLFVFDKQPRELISRAIGMTYQNIDREIPLEPTPEEVELQNYKLYNLYYQYWNPKVIHEKRALVNFQVSNNFSKIFGEFYWRWKFAHNKRLGVRIFGGSFINQNLESTDYFDFGLDRISDYTFSYPLLGRSEETGLLSQQFVLAEGGFKSNFNVRANQYMYTLNLEYPIWKMIDIYADAGVYKSKLAPVKMVYDSGVRVRVIPDFLELYFPLQSSLGFEPTLGAYHERIRFMLNLDIGKVVEYWRRGKY
ncbi:MAG: hypothetical protein Q4G27_10085 [Flavobacteriaceae bacterium]|nr:hypothetical protein [Flavobacteriaceae bacterium]